MKMAALDCWYTATQQVGRPRTSVMSRMKFPLIRKNRSYALPEGHDGGGQMGHE